MQKHFIMSNNKVNQINIIKVIAVLCVFLLHASIYSSQYGFVFNESNWFLKTPSWSAVWIFFIISGALIGKGFHTGKYKENGQYTFRSIVKFYFNRFLKIGIPTWIFSFLSTLLLEPEYFFNNKKTVFHILTFTYKNIPASLIIGSTWYISTLMWLYLCAPFLMLLLEKIFSGGKEKNIYVFVLYMCVIISGLLLRLSLYKIGLDWSSKIYVPFYCNLDLYICGMLTNFIQISPPKKTFIPTMLLIFMAAIIINTRMYYRSDYDKTCLIMCQYIFPSIYICIVSPYMCHSICNDYLYEKVTLKKLLHNPFRLIDIFSNISFEFYLTHCMVLNEIAPYIKNNINAELMHFNLIAYSFVITFILSFLLHNCFHKKHKINKIVKGNNE